MHFRGFEGYSIYLIHFYDYLKVPWSNTLKYHQVHVNFNHQKFLKIFNLIDIWGVLKSFLQMVEDLKVIFRSKNRKGYRSLIMRSPHSITSCDQKTINVSQIINVKIITSDLPNQFQARYN